MFTTDCRPRPIPTDSAPATSVMRSSDRPIDEIASAMAAIMPKIADREFQRVFDAGVEIGVGQKFFAQPVLQGAGDEYTDASTPSAMNSDDREIVTSPILKPNSTARSEPSRSLDSTPHGAIASITATIKSSARSAPAMTTDACRTAFGWNTDDMAQPFGEPVAGPADALHKFGQQIIEDEIGGADHEQPDDLVSEEGGKAI